MAAKAQAVFARHHDVEYDDVEGMAAKMPARFRHRSSLNDTAFVARKILRQRFTKVAIVIDDQHVQRRVRGRIIGSDGFKHYKSVPAFPADGAMSLTYMQFSIRK